jgi:hypothetical protein
MQVKGALSWPHVWSFLKIARKVEKSALREVSEHDKLKTLSYLGPKANGNELFNS